MNKLKTILFIACRMIVGAVFLFSGFVKAIDPLGSVYKIQDYLEAMHLVFLSPLATVASFLLFATEFICGAMLLLNISFRWGLWLATAFMVAMTPLTLWIALENPVSDCGCFGDALVISNWATFWKNIVLSSHVALLWAWRRYHREWLRPVPSMVACIVIFCCIMMFGFHAVMNLPIVDFRPYSIGTNIYEGMQLPEGAKTDVYEDIYIYADRDGALHEFALADAPFSDPDYTFVDARHTLLEKGDEPAIHDFSITDTEGVVITDDILFDDERRTYFVVMYDLHKADIALLPAVDSLQRIAAQEDARFLVLTASSDCYQEFALANGVDYPFAFVDPIQLKTMVRANPGVVILEQGTVVDKFNLYTRRHQYGM